MKRTVAAIAVITVVAVTGCVPQTASEACCACLADNVCILSEDEEACTEDLAAGITPDRTERPFGEGIAVNVDCAESQCANCIETTLDATAP